MNPPNPPPEDVSSAAPPGSIWNGVTRLIQRAVRNPGGIRLPRFQGSTPGAAPGLDAGDLAQLPSGTERVYLTCMDYCPEQICEVDILDIDAFLKQHRPEWSKVRWINLDGLTDMKVIAALTAKYDLHPLAVEDMLQASARPKFESYPATAAGDGDDRHGRLFLIARMIWLKGEQLCCEKINFFLGERTLLTFQPNHDEDDVWEPVRNRLHQEHSRTRKQDASFLLYALLDAIVDHCFPVMEHYSEKLEDLEEEVLTRSNPGVISRIHHLKRELTLLRREFWPMRELIHGLQRSDDKNLSETTALYLRDVYDHSVQVIDLLETYREVTIGLTETHMNAMSNRMNEVMKVLTIFATIFMPLSFLAGVYGMNFTEMPELHDRWMYPYGFWGLCVLTVILMLVWFRRRKWL